MNGNPATIIRSLRALMPARPLEDHEAEGLAERQATKLLELFGCNEAPVNVALIAELPRLEVVVRANQELAGVSGFSEWGKGRWIVAVNRDDSQTRRRFTLAHEFKHVLDHPFIRVLYTDRTGKASDQRAEAICDYFAACLLMPRPWVKRAWVSGIQDQEQLALRFRVSPAAMGRRLIDLGLVEPRSRYRVSTSITRYFRTGSVTAPSLPVAA